MEHTLYVIAVPIGNLKEITILAKEKLEEISVIFCEDTRVTNKLFHCLGIDSKKEFYCVNQFSEMQSMDFIMEKLRKSDCALVSDAGYPIISDPGYFLIKSLREKNVNIQVINGPCAFIHAIVCSGVDSRKIFWANFLTKKEIKRKKELQDLIYMHKKTTIVFYESPNFLIKGLEIIKDVFGDIKVAVCRELTKLHETFYFDHVSNLVEQIKTQGEFVVIIPRSNEDDLDDNQDLVLQKIFDLVDDKNISLKDAIKICKHKNHNSSDLYKEYIKRYKD